ncbi:hypothetical protein HPB47_009107 [Ixodes persulcatus]|uniref:Uncharacterized protein n=1 Tax=Ixodes persulcatus TaxID=34615 RepID=A0AC60P347_IXOPE|nr:hypothetical protein HPB47_009107 [Ixodes persulcatus]
MGDNAALANEFELPFSDLTPTEREMLSRTSVCSEARACSGFGPDEEHPKNDEGPDASAQGRRPEGIAGTRADE